MKKVLLATVSACSIFLLVSCGGNSNEPTTRKNPYASAESGEAIYKRTCFACHQLDGKGIANTFPPLAKSDFITDRVQTITQIIKGKSGEVTVNGNKFNNVMPPQVLTDQQIADVLTYVTNSWGNTATPYTVR